MRFPLPRLLAVSAAAFLAAAACQKSGPLSETKQILWTTCTITLYDHASRQNLEACFARLREIDARMSVGVPGSELDAIDAAAGKAPVRVTDDVLLVTKKALQIARLSDGLFDPTVGPLISVWKIDQEHPEIPSKRAIEAARARVNWKDVVVDDAAKTIYLEHEGMQLDLGALVKGYAADEARRILSARGVTSAIIDLGGDIFAMGHGQTGQAWRIGVQNPDAERGVSLGIANVMNKSVVTSGVYEHFFIKNGKRYHHLMDTRTGYPVDNGLESVTVITNSSMDADGYGLALFCMGKKAGLELGTRLGLGVVMVGVDHKVYATPETKRYFAITDPSFTYAD
jgi:FAD:protein FMN transferase